jgi:tRNA(fMet)-specific endonuclease VapC
VTKYLFDTNSVSALMRSTAGMLVRVESASRANIAVPQVVYAEVAYGIERMPEGKKKEALRNVFKLVRGELSSAPWTDDVTDAFGRVKATLERQGTRLEDFDIAIAAHAIAMDRVLITSNEKHMSRVSGLRWEDWSNE